MAKIRNCLMDNTEYKYCPDCADNNKDESWRFLYCSERCRDIDFAVRAYKSNKNTLGDVKNILAKYDITSDANFTDYGKAQLSEFIKNTPVQQQYENRSKKKNKFNKQIVNEEDNVITEDVAEEPII